MPNIEAGSVEDPGNFFTRVVSGYKGYVDAYPLLRITRPIIEEAPVGIKDLTGVVFPNEPDWNRWEPDCASDARYALGVGHSIIENNRRHFLNNFGEEIDYTHLPLVIGDILMLNDEEVERFLEGGRNRRPKVNGIDAGMGKIGMVTRYLTARFLSDTLKPEPNGPDDFSEQIREPSETFQGKSILEAASDMPKLTVGRIYERYSWLKSKQSKV